MKKLAKKKRKPEIPDSEKSYYVVKRFKPTEKEKLPTTLMLETARDTLIRCAEDEITSWRYAISVQEGRRRWWEWLGDPRRVRKTDPRAVKMFNWQAQQVVQAIIDSGAVISNHEYEEIPFCEKHS